jgi:hypothetical protein
MSVKEIDLSGFKDKGVTLHVAFDAKAPVDPFFIFITNETGDILFYYRKINKANVTINLPVHSDKVLLNIAADHAVKSIIQQPIQIDKIKYKPDARILQTRNYPIEAITTQVLPVISIPLTDEKGNDIRNYDGSYRMMPTDQPARFMPSIGLKQLSQSIMSKMPQPTRVFVMDHEEGHYYYGRPVPPKEVLKIAPLEYQQEFQKQIQEDEEAADNYALHKLINQGYNYSGVFSSLEHFLPDNYISKQRIQKMFNTIQKYNKDLV